MTMNVSERRMHVDTGFGFPGIPRLSHVRKVKSCRFRVSTPSVGGQGGGRVNSIWT